MPTPGRAGGAARALAGAAVALAAATLAAPGGARAQLFSDNEARRAIIDLRARVQEQEERVAAQLAELGRRLERLEAAQRGQLEFANTVEAQRQEIARLRGQIDVMAKEVADLQKRNRDLYADLDARLKALEPRALVIDGRSVTVGRDEQAAYDAALAALRAGDHRAAAAAFQGFVARFPDSPYVPAAQYWIGSAHYQLKDYRAAIAAQQVVVERYPDSPRAAEALLLIAASQAELNDRARARAALEQLVKDYPGSDAARIGRERLAAMGAAKK
jgi:tol-pal system protein YbgF